MPLGECNASEIRFGSVVIRSVSIRSIVFFCDRTAGGCGAQNRWDATDQNHRIAEQMQSVGQVGEFA